jgi:hypothetical protein
MNMELIDIYPVKIATYDLKQILTVDEFVSLQDAVENTSADTHERLKKPQSPPAVTDSTLFMNENHTALMKIKKDFHESCIALHESKFPNLAGKFHIYDSICKGIVVNSMTTMQDTMSNYPWHYTGIAIVRAPDTLPEGQGDVVFIDPLPVSEKGDQHGVIAKRGNMTIFPSWLKYRFRPIAYQETEYDTVMMLVMNSFVVHERLEDFAAKERAAYRGEESEAPLFQLGPTGDRGDTELTIEPPSNDSDASDGIDIGRF